MMGAVHILKRERGITYREVEKDLTKRAADFEIANGLLPVHPDFVKEFFGIESSMEDSHRVLFLDLASKRDGSYFRTGVVYDLESRAFSIPTAEQQARLGREDFGIHRGAVDFHPLVLKPSPTPTAPARETETNAPRLDLLRAKSLIAKSLDDLLKAEEAARAQNQDLLTQMVLEEDITIRGR